MCLGKTADNLFLQIEECYRSAVNVMDYHFYFPEVAVLSAKTILSNSPAEFGIGLAEEEALKDAVKNTDYGEACCLTDRIIQRCLDGGYPEPDKFRSGLQSLFRHISLFFQMEDAFEQFWQQEGGEENIGAFKNKLYALLELLVKKTEEKNRTETAALQSVSGVI